ncbi:unnamed protein product [Menidia menidia]|uniref:Gypsy retrotransposon integrase-like protein 1 n=1 Tax=Menidia menidia TaxID=238744 RepID=A0A8S4BTD9_9TELE|nr:unnamed protein product [Menidia menidia]
MALEPDFSVFDSNMDIDSLQFIPPQQRAPDLCQQVQELKDDVKQLRNVFQNTLSLQQKMLNHLDKVHSCESDGPSAQQSPAAPVATSTPYVPLVNIGAGHSNDACPYPETQRDLHSSFLQTHSAELTNTSRVIAAALHHAKLEPPVFAGDGEVQAVDWLQAVSAYKSTLNLTDAQILNELPRFLTKKPSKWFKALRSHISSWVHFCQLFQTVFLPTDNQERILRGILDRVQSDDEPLPTFVAHMLSEFNKLCSPPPEKERIQLICKHSLEKYRVALYGSPTLTEPQLSANTLHILGHVEDNESNAVWNTPFKTKLNFNGTCTEATLDTGASLSAVRADLINLNGVCPQKVRQWQGPPVSLADNAPCLPEVLLSDRSHMRQLQMDDPVTGPLLRDIESDSSVQIDSECQEQYTVYDSLLYCRDRKPVCSLHPLKELKLFAPTSLRGTMLRYYHDHPTAGHLGVSKTLMRLRHRFFWPGMAGDVKRYVTSCSVCQLTKPSQQKQAGLMVPIVPKKPWEYTGVQYPETLRATLRDAHHHARAALDLSHKRQKHYYDLRRRHSAFGIGDLVRVKSHPRSDALANFTAKLAPLFKGPFRVSQKLSDVNYRLIDVETGADA